MGPGMMGRGYGMGPGMMHGGWSQMSPEQQKEWKRMEIAFWKDTLQLRQKLINKQMELSTLWQEENPDSDKAKDLSDEISDLQSQLLKRRNNFLIQCRKKFGDQGWACPGAGFDIDPGMMGPEMMHGGRGMGRQYGSPNSPGNQGPQYQQPQKPMDEDHARSLLENYIQSTRNPNLKLGRIEDKGNAFEAEIKTKEGSLVDKILVDKRTGWMRSVY
jgi:hypothetical protein